MYGVQGMSVKLDEAYVAETGIVAQLEQQVQTVMFNMRDFDYTAEKAFWDGAQKELTAAR